MAAGSNTLPRTDPVQAHGVARARGSFFSHVFTLASGAGVSQGINVLGTLVLAHLIAPRDFGLFALFVTVVTFVSVIGGARYELAIMLPERDSEAANIAVLAALVAAGIAAASIPAIALLGAPLAKLLGDVRAEHWLWFIPPVLLLNGLGEIGRNWFGRTKDFRFVAIARVCQSIGLIGGQLTLWFLGFGGGIALIGGWLIGQTTWTGVLLAHLIARDGRFISCNVQGGLIPKLAAKYRAFPIYRTPFSFIANGMAQLIFVILRLFCGLNVVGIYLMANRAIYFPVALFGSSLGQVFYQKAATEIKSSKLEPFVNRLIRSQIAIAAPSLIFFAFEAPLVFDTLLGPRWERAGTFAAWLAFAAFLYLINSWLSKLFDVCGHQRLALVLQIGAGTTSLGALTLALYWGHGAIDGIAAFTVSEVICTIIWLICAYRIAGFHTGNLLKLGKDFSLAALPIALVGFAVHHFLSAWPACALMLAAAGCATWLLWKVYGTHGTASAATAQKSVRNRTSQNGFSRGTDSAECCRAWAAEIRSLFPSEYPKRVLHIGCGDGSAFACLGLPVSSYRGIDFSPQFLDAFRSRYPQIAVELAEEPDSIKPGGSYEVIFSNGLVQYFDREALMRHLRNARAMMHRGSVLILGSIPDRRYQKNLSAGASLSAVNPRRTDSADTEFWYTPGEIVEMAKRCGYRVHVFPSRFTSNRFHAVASPILPASEQSAPQRWSRKLSAPNANPTRFAIGR
jgi:lipopolysaccharide exporter